MSKKANPTLIGAFVFGAIVLSVGLIVTIGSGQLFRKSYDFVIFFDEAVSGLDIGAPVEYEGVRVGTVTDIRIVSDVEHQELYIPVFMQIEPDRITYVGSGDPLSCPEEICESFIEHGLACQLQSQSFVTGKKKIQIVSKNEQPLLPMTDRGLDVVQLPTIRSSLGELSSRINDIPLADIAAKADETLEGLSELVNSDELRGAISNMNSSLAGVAELTVLARHALSEEGPVLKGVSQTLTDISEAADSIEALVLQINTETLPRAESVLTNSIAKALEVVDEATAMLHQSRPMGRDAYDTLEEVRAASRALRRAAEYLQQNPDSLIKGKSTKEN